MAAVAQLKTGAVHERISEAIREEWAVYGPFLKSLNISSTVMLLTGGA